MRKPVFNDDIERLGEKFWIEAEGYDTMVQGTSGNFAGIDSKILGWNCKTLGEIWQKEKEVNYAPRVRYWRGEERPTEEERRAGRWDGRSRLWTPNVRFNDRKQVEARFAEWEETGRTQWPAAPDPEDPVALNLELAEKGEEPLAPMCAGCHFGHWKSGEDRRWYDRADGKGRYFSPCSNIGVDGWLWWQENITEPPSCEGYCKIGEHKPEGIWADFAKAIHAIGDAEV